MVKTIELIAINQTDLITTMMIINQLKAIFLIDTKRALYWKAILRKRNQSLKEKKVQKILIKV